MRQLAFRRTPLSDVLDGKQQRSVRIAFRDNGPGIEDKYLERIFEKFFQVPGSPSGTGLGLAISKEFIEAQGGKIKANSVVGKGTAFSFQLPKALRAGGLPAGIYLPELRIRRKSCL